MVFAFCALARGLSGPIRQLAEGMERGTRRRQSFGAAKPKYSYE